MFDDIFNDCISCIIRMKNEHIAIESYAEQFLEPTKRKTEQVTTKKLPEKDDTKEAEQSNGDNDEVI